MDKSSKQDTSQSQPMESKLLKSHKNVRGYEFDPSATKRKPNMEAGSSTKLEESAKEQLVSPR